MTDRLDRAIGAGLAACRHIEGETERHRAFVRAAVLDLIAGLNRDGDDRVVLAAIRARIGATEGEG